VQIQRISATEVHLTSDNLTGFDQVSAASTSFQCC